MKSLSRLVVLDIDAGFATHLVLALADYHKRLRCDGMAIPSQLRQLTESLAARASEGPRGTVVDVPLCEGERPVMAPRLMSYAEAATALACSHRQVKRLVAAGDLKPVRLGGLARLAIADIDQLIEERKA